MALADLDRDGAPDLIVANGNDTSPQPLTVYYNQSCKGGTYQNPAKAFNVYPDWYSSDVDHHVGLAVGDINGDGWVDVAVSVVFGKHREADKGGVKIYLNDGHGHLEAQPSTPMIGGYMTTGCALGDVNGDGKLDLAVAVEYLGSGPVPPKSKGIGSNLPFPKGGVKIYLNQNGSINPTEAWSNNNHASAWDVTFADIDQDGQLDLVAAATNTMVFYGLGPSSNKPFKSTPDWQSSETHVLSMSVDAGRIGNDRSTLSLAVSSGCDNGCSSGFHGFLLYQPKGQGQSTYLWHSPPATFSSRVFLSDLDGDNNLELLASQWVTNSASEPWATNTALGAPLWFFTGLPSGFALKADNQTGDWTASQPAIGQGIATADLKRRGVTLAQETIPPDSAHPSRSVVTLTPRRIERLVSVQRNGSVLPTNQYTFVPNGNWIALATPLQQQEQLIVSYEISPIRDIVLANNDNCANTCPTTCGCSSMSGPINGNFIYPSSLTASPGTTQCLTSP